VICRIMFSRFKEPSKKMNAPHSCIFMKERINVHLIVTLMCLSEEEEESMV
jgi:hypothetical protein